MPQVVLGSDPARRGRGHGAVSETQSNTLSASGKLEEHERAFSEPRASGTSADLLYVETFGRV